MGKVYPYLVCAACAKRAGRQKTPLPRRQHTIARAGRLALRAHAPAQNGIAPAGNGAAELARFGGRRAPAQSVIYLLRAFCQQRRGIGVHGAQHKAAGAFIQPVYGAEHTLLPPRTQKTAKGICQRAAHLAARGVHSHARRFFQHHGVLVLIHDGKWDILRNNAGVRLRRKLKAYSRARRHALVCAGGHAVCEKTPAVLHTG